MEINLNERKEQLANLGIFISSAANQIDSIVESLGWSVNNLKKDEVKCACPCDPNHVVSQKTANEHIKKCSLKSLGYKLDEQFLSEPSHSKYSIKLDHSTKVEVLNKARTTQYDFRAVWDGRDEDPKTSNRLTSTYSADERLALYKYCVQNVVKPNVPDEFSLFSETDVKDDKSLSFEELLALKRDAKRRRVKYRTVHTNRKSHTEVMKEVIENQMELYEDWVISKNGLKPKNQNDDQLENVSSCEDVNRPNSSISRHSTHSGSSRHTSSRISNEHYKDHEKRKDLSRSNSKHDNNRSSERDRHHRRHRRENYESKHRRSRERHYSEERKHRSRDRDYFENKRRRSKDREYPEQKSHKSRDQNYKRHKSERR